MNIEQLFDKVRGMAAEAGDLADALRGIEEVPGESWVQLEGIARDLAELERDLRSEMLALPRKTIERELADSARGGA
jgi:hypothetical protein